MTGPSRGSTLDGMTATPVTEQSPLLQMPFAAMTAKIVHAPAELRLADLLADGSRTSAELAERAGVDTDSLAPVAAGARRPRRGGADGA